MEWLLARKPNNLLIVVTALVPIGTIGYVLIEGLDLLDALYQTMITLSTVGYSDLVESDAGRIFNIVFMAVGVGIFVMTLSLLAAFLVEGRLREAIGRRRMERDIAELRNHIIVCGYGRFGQLVSDHLDGYELDFAVVEADGEKIGQAEGQGRLALQADATEDQSLIRAGIQHARGVISTLGSDASNVYVALTAKEIRPDVMVVTMARDPSAESKLRAAGADYVVSPYTIGATNMARRITQPHLSHFLDSAHGVKVRLEEIVVRAGSPLAHHAIKDTPIRRKHGVTLVAVVKTREDDVRYNPDPELMIEAGDVLVAVGSPDGLAGLGADCATPRD
jgi:voltage-gated potassium channel